MNNKSKNDQRLLYSNVILAHTSGRRDEGELVPLHSVFDDFRVDAGHSVDSMRSHNAQMSHVDFLDVPFLDQGHSAQAVNISRVNLGDALEGRRKETPQSMYRAQQ